jgi:hypothetical protein
MELTLYLAVVACVSAGRPSLADERVQRGGDLVVALARGVLVDQRRAVLAWPIRDMISLRGGPPSAP